MNRYPIALSALLLLCLSLSSFAQQISATVHFDTDSDVLKHDAKKTLKKFVNDYKDISFEEILLEGHTDSRSNEAYNLDLAQRRAYAVKTYLADLKVQENKLRIKSFGESSPAASNNSEYGRRKNRRVKINLISAYLGSTEVGPEIIDPLGQKKINLNGNSFTLGPEGAIVSTDKGVTFAFDEDRDAEIVEIEIRESTNQKEMMDEDFNTTMTNGESLESQYMFCMENLSGQPRDKVEVSIPKEYVDVEGRGWYKQVEGKWEDTKVEMTDYYQDSCDCYVMIIRSGCYNIDVPTGSNELLMAKFDNRHKIGNQFFGLLPKYTRLEPKFYFLPEGVNANIIPLDTEKKKVLFTGIGEDWTGELIGVVEYKGKKYIAQESINIAELKTKRDKKVFPEKLKFNKTHEEELGELLTASL